LKTFKCLLRFFVNLVRKLYNHWRYESKGQYEQWIKDRKDDILELKGDIESTSYRLKRNKEAPDYSDKQEDLSWDNRVINYHKREIEECEECIKEYERIIREIQ